MVIMMKSVFPVRLRSLIGATSTAVLLIGCGGDGSSTSAPAILRVLQNQLLVANAVGSPGSQSALLTGFTFEVAEPLTSPSEPAAGYEITPNEPSSEELSRLAESFGITAPFEPQPEELGGGLVAGPNDGTGPMLSVMNDVMRVWNYSPAWADMAMSECLDPNGTSEMGTGELSTDCSDTSPPEQLPSFGEAQEMFGTLMIELGVATQDFIVEVGGDEWGVTVNGIKKIDGVRSPFTWSVTYGENGSILAAYGVFNDAVRRIGEYPRISTDEALTRLADEQAALADGEAGVGVVEPDSLNAKVARLDSIEEELYIFYGAQGEVYLVPGYTFVGEPLEGDYVLRFIVSAVPDQYIERVGDPVTDGSDSSGGASSPSDPGDGMTIEPGDDSSVDVPDEIPLDEANAVLGMTEAEATTYAEGQGWTVRIAARDGEQFPLTMDYMPKRVNLSIDQGLVSYVFIG